MLAFACKCEPAGSPQQVAGIDTARPEVAGRLNADSIGYFAPRIEGPGKEYASFQFNHIAVSAHAFYYEDPRDDFASHMETNFLILRDPSKKVADTLPLATSDGDMSAVKIEDLSDSLHFKSLVLKLSTTGSSDMPIDELVEYKDGKLRSLCMLEFMWEISRKDDSTLLAIIRGRDEVLAYPYNYPVTINLRNGSITGDMPDTQAIKFATLTLEPITVFKVNGPELSGPLIIKRGVEVVVDTFFRKTGRVRLLLPDSTPVYILDRDLTQKVESNTAG